MTKLGQRATMRAEFKSATINREGGLVIQLAVEDLQAGNALDFIGVLQNGPAEVTVVSDQLALDVTVTLENQESIVDPHTGEVYSPIGEGITGASAFDPATGQETRT